MVSAKKASAKKPGKLSSSHRRVGDKPKASPKVFDKPAAPEPAEPPAKNKKPTAKKQANAETRCGTVALVGRPNVGKSTLVNALVGFKLSIATPKPQTTRDRILGVLTRDGSQLVFLDTPGLHTAKNKLGAHMNTEAEEAARTADVIVYVTEPPKGTRAEKDPTLERVLGIIGDRPLILAINKVDRVKEKGALIPILESYGKLHEFAAYVPIVAAKGGEGSSNGLERLLDEIGKHLPLSPFLFPEDEITDRPERFLAAECVREQVILQTRDELPYAIAVTIDAWEEPASAKAVTRIEATIHVEKDAQRKIVIGAGGDRIKKIGVAARKSIEELLGRRVHLQLFVRTEEAWSNDERKLAELGYEAHDE